MKAKSGGAASAGLALAALGIVYGDIGTSPLYALKAAVQAAGGAGSTATVVGVVSLLLWSLILIVSIKYASLIMQADNQGEGGVVAMLALLNATPSPARRVRRCWCSAWSARRCSTATARSRRRSRF